MSVTINGTTGLVFNDASTQTTAATGFGFKNRIINGDMRIDQRNNGASVTPANGVYFLDRYAFGLTQASKITAQQNQGSVTPPAGFTRYFGITSSSAYSLTSTDEFEFWQNIEGFNIADFAWGTASAATVTLSFWVRSSLTGTFAGVLKNADSTRTYPYSYTINAANTWEQKAITIVGETSGTWNTTNGIGIGVWFSLGAGSATLGTAGAWTTSNVKGVTGQTNLVSTNGATFYITGVQLEKGSTATSFDYRPYGTELQLCQRYYQKTYDIGEVPGTNTAASYWNSGTTAISTTATWGASWRFPVEMRASPTATAYTTAGTAGSLSWAYSNTQGSGAVTEFGKGSKAVSFYHNATASGLVAGGGVVLIGHIVVSAEL